MSDMNRQKGSLINYVLNRMYVPDEVATALLGISKDGLLTEINLLYEDMARIITQLKSIPIGNLSKEDQVQARQALADIRRVDSCIGYLSQYYAHNTSTEQRQRKKNIEEERLLEYIANEMLYPTAYSHGR